MTSIADSSVKIQTTEEANFSTPSWFGEVVLLVTHLKKQGGLTKLCEQVRLARKRFGRYEVIDFLAHSSATRSVASAPWRSFTSVFSRLRTRSCRSLSVIGSLPAQHSRGF